jgi:hypothetical protein
MDLNNFITYIKTHGIKVNGLIRYPRKTNNLIKYSTMNDSILFSNGGTERSQIAKIQKS